MNQPLSHLVLWLYVINLGLACGAGLYEHRVSLPLWFHPGGADGPRWNADAARNADSGRRFWAFVTTGPLTLLTLASLFAVSGAPPAAQGFWWASIGATLLERAMTFGYFIPTMVSLTGTGATSPGVTARARRWAALGNVRMIAAVAGWIAALAAFANA